MNNRPSAALFLQSQDATVKYDYFVCTAAGALFAYAGQTYSPHKFDSFPAFLAPIAILLFAISFGWGLERAKKQIYVVQRNQRALEHKESAGDIARMLEDNEAAIKANPNITFRADGQELTVSQLSGLLSMKFAEAAKIESELVEHVKHSNNIASRRDKFLLAGFFVLLIAKTLQPYLGQ